MADTTNLSGLTNGQLASLGVKKRPPPKMSGHKFAVEIIKLTQRLGMGDADMQSIVNGCLECAIAGAVDSGLDVEKFVDYVRTDYARQKAKPIPRRH